QTPRGEQVEDGDGAGIGQRLPGVGAGAAALLPELPGALGIELAAHGRLAGWRFACSRAAASRSSRSANVASSAASRRTSATSSAKHGVAKSVVVPARCTSLPTRTIGPPLLVASRV